MSGGGPGGNPSTCMPVGHKNKGDGIGGGIIPDGKGGGTGGGGKFLLPPKFSEYNLQFVSYTD